MRNGSNTPEIIKKNQIFLFCLLKTFSICLILNHMWESWNIALLRFFLRIVSVIELSGKPLSGFQKEVCIREMYSMNFQGKLLNCEGSLPQGLSEARQGIWFILKIF